MIVRQWLSAAHRAAFVATSIAASLALAQERQLTLVEEFDGRRNQDLLAAGATWGPRGLVPGVLGDDGVLGDFDPADGQDLGVVDGLRTYLWSTDQQLIPAARTLTGQALTVTDGVFRFATFLVPPGVRVRFSGSHALQLRVAGVALVAGVVDVNGESTADNFNGAQAGSAAGNRQGQRGARGGPGAGSGGAGGAVPGLAGFQPDGYPGQNVVAAPGHPYAATALGTGGGGSPAQPPGGNVALVNYCFSVGFFCRQINTGGAGGSLSAQVLGAAGSADTIPTGCTSSIFGAPSLPGTAFQLLPEVAGVSARVQFVVGGAGGGGAGVNPYNSIRGQVVSWKPGGGAGGGGGAAALATGLGLAVLPGGGLLARGGNAGNPINIGFAAPGGGGSGGTLLLQAPLYYLGGLIDVRGGAGGLWRGAIAGDPRALGGAGGAGFLRLESVARPDVAALGAVLPPPGADNTGVLQDQDLATLARSLWFSHAAVTPTQARFRIDARIGGVPVVYSDDPQVGIQPVRGTTPIAFFLQGAQVDPATRAATPGTLTPWVDRAAALLPFGRDGLRWAVVLDRGILGAGTPIEVLRVEVLLRG